MRVVVIGSGVAGTMAALAARKTGAEVIAVAGRPGASAQWSGVVELFGPSNEPPPIENLLGRSRQPEAHRPPGIAPGDRFERLMDRRRFHPYARVGLGFEAVAGHFQEALELADLEIVASLSPACLANAHGLLRLADGCASSLRPGLLPLAGSTRDLTVWGFSHYPAFDPEVVANQLQHQGLAAEARWIDLPDAPLCQSVATAATVLEGMAADRLEEIGRSIAEGTGERVALVPPILGRTMRSHRSIRDGLTQKGERADLAELASVHNSLHGFRLIWELQAALEAAGVAVRQASVQAFSANDRRIASVTLDSGERLTGDAFVLATGRAMAGGFQRSEPFTETLFGLPLYLDGMPLDPLQRDSATLVSRSLVDDHPLFRVGVGVNQRLQPLDVDLGVAFDNLFSAGGLLAGTHFALDGSAFGVALVTGLLAGRTAVEAEVTPWV
ncbi:MAG: FAD-dependent oxidoreductase [Bradymonadales bacterium]|nr:FAD-dependent oxidoreductase [Bradymonadales bacterium]